MPRSLLHPLQRDLTVAPSPSPDGAAAWFALNRSGSERGFLRVPKASRSDLL